MTDKNLNNPESKKPNNRTPEDLKRLRDAVSKQENVEQQAFIWPAEAFDTLQTSEEIKQLKARVEHGQATHAELLRFRELLETSAQETTQEQSSHKSEFFSDRFKSTERLAKAPLGANFADDLRGFSLGALDSLMTTGKVVARLGGDLLKLPRDVVNIFRA